MTKPDKCYKCGTELIIDPIGYSPSCAWCPKCNKIRDNNYDENERIRQKAKKEVFDDIEKNIPNLKADKYKGYIIWDRTIEELKERHLSTLEKPKEPNGSFNQDCRHQWHQYRDNMNLIECSKCGEIKLSSPK